MSRRQVSGQILSLLQGAGVLGGSSSALESIQPAENYLASGLPFPIAVVMTEESDGDKDVPRRSGPGRFRVSVASGPVTEAELANYAASGGSGSSQHGAENAVSGLIAGMSTEGMFTDAKHGFQGFVNGQTKERLVVAQSQWFAIAEFDITVTNLTYADYYQAPRNLSATPGAAHTVALAWTNPATIFNQYQNVLRRGTNAGDAAPTSPTGGTGVAITGGVLGTSATDTLGGSGLTYNYAIFRTYSAITTGDKASIGNTATAVTT
jgi:hypothetical protein